MSKILLFGSTGWIGGKLKKIFEKNGFVVVPSSSRLDQYVPLIQEIEKTDANIIVNAAGITGRPNIDWCEDNKIKTLEINTVGTSVLVSTCYRMNKYYVYIGTGCIYEYDGIHDSVGFTEEDPPNFQKSWYSHTKVMIENITKSYPDTLTLRVRMPISDDLHPRSFITKIKSYKKVINVKNSVTVLHDLLPLIPDMIEKRLTGVFNFVNPGTISHHEILDLYRLYIDHEFTYEGCEIGEQQIKAPRSNNHLCVDKLLKYYFVPNIQTSIHGVFQRMKEKVI